ncbi:MAG TPA: hypothetical protein VIS73_10435 [Rhodocyclaceae bacterium]
MLSNTRALDVTGTVRTDDPSAVARACIAIQQHRYGKDAVDSQFLFRAFEEARRAYFGESPDWLACDTPYHDLRHALDTALCATRLADGFDIAAKSAEQRLGARLAATTTVLALLHDTGFLRSRHQEDGQDGARFMAEHEARSVAWVRASPLAAAWPELAACAELIQATNIAADALASAAVADQRRAAMANIIGTADFLAQIADRYYLEKCRDFLYTEFVRAGMDRRQEADGSTTVLYLSGEDLLRQTPGFFASFGPQRLDQRFARCHTCLDVHFGGRNPYLEAASSNLARLEKLLATGRLGELRRRPRALPPSAQSKK